MEIRSGPVFSDVTVVNGQAVVVTNALFAPVPAVWVRAVSHGGAIAAVAQAGADTCQVVDAAGRRWDSGDLAFGQQCVAIRVLDGQWEVVWMRGPTGETYARLRLDAELRPIGPWQEFPSPCGMTTQGFLDLAPDGAPIMTDTHRTIQCGPVLMVLPTTRGVWTIGQDAFEDRIVAWDAARQQAFEVWRGKTQVPSHLALEADGTAVVCIGGTEILVRQPAFVPLSSTPGAIVPPVATTARPIAVGCHDEAGAPNLTGHGWPSTPETVGVMVTLNQESAEIVAAQDARAAREGLPLYCYMDKSAFAPDEMPPQREARRLAMPRYGVSPGAVPAMQAELRATVRTLQAAGYDLTMNLQLTRGLKGDGTYHFTEQEVIDAAVAAWQVCVDEHVLAVWGFAWDRADGIIAFPSFQQFVAAIRAATPEWQTFPGVTPTPEPPDPPDPPDPPIPPVPALPAFPLELLMSEGAFVVDKKRLVLNTKADIDPNDPGAGVFVQPHCFHMKHDDGGFVSIGPDEHGDWQPSPTGSKYVSSRENFQWDGKSDRCLINCGPPLNVRGFAVMDPS